ncbi:short-chain dehydrogenase/reductase SDR [Pseudonocardia dioxanivorans CB1190]|uniref:Short-chain dehydrogenase/reductase SDR n=1 Tax=Pseudonocardia dioxanivorans (strain ATCC 55486 / DSM 44775 / JCM 13855 / CB1190) TaxID=675635 RepID=F4D105_PSEUX|nr:SDR family NAD(P)-dependent oxidoreductase [Pseudonocardia dioxanivorans]AEA25857.1 short-chain dehydrogenase/reductase SDR [Pseudonocardia dioxanivorans CB1190]GJF06383.1 oxidoreductase [Pseudonocardia sp. D17]
MSTPAGGTAVVTGGSSGIGAAVALRLAAAGWDVVVSGRDRTRLAAVAAACGGTAVEADLARPDGVEAVRSAAEGRVRLLVHGAGLGWAGPVADTPPDAVSAMLAVNLDAPIRLTNALLPTLRDQDGHVVFVASVAAIGVAGEAVYSATKAGLRGFADAVRLESGVRVTTVLPGAVDTPYFARRGTPYHRRFPRPVSADRVAAAVVDSVGRDRAEVFVPRWLTLGARVHGAVPATFARLSRRFDPPAR